MAKMSEQQEAAIQRLEAQVERLRKLRIKVPDLVQIDHLTREVQHLAEHGTPNVRVVEAGLTNIKAASARCGPQLTLELPSDQDEWLQQMMRSAMGLLPPQEMPQRFVLRAEY